MCQFIDDFWVKIIEIRLKMIQKKKKKMKMIVKKIHRNELLCKSNEV